jgi:PhzF family phenazine biosynthesis protein
MMGAQLLQVDAFTDRPFAGNPAAVCLLSAPGEAAWMQLVAREMNLPETAFLYQMDDGYNLRWFTPAVEVNLCGHATLAGAHTLWETGHAGVADQLRFHTRSGLLTARRVGDRIEINLPANPPQPSETSDSLDLALGTTPVHVGTAGEDFLVELDSERAVRALAPDLARIRLLPVHGVMVTARASTAGYDFVSRYFAPSIGIDEDPVTGAMHCAVGPYWGAKLLKTEMVGYQASARGGVVGVRLAGDRVYLQGQAVTVLRGELV